MIRILSYLTLIVVVMFLAINPPARAEEPEPDHIRGVITKMEDSAIILETSKGSSEHLVISENLTIIKLTKASFTDVDYGLYVGAVSVRLNAYSPIVRDSLSWLHQGFELRIIDEKLRGIALGHKNWDLTPETVMTHGWVDDQETRVISIKFGPTEEEETDVEVPRDVPVQKMTLGDRSLLKPGCNIFAGARKGEDGKYVAAFVFIGEEGATPAL